jgi:hypothetical protein
VCVVRAERVDPPDPQPGMPRGLLLKRLHGGD